MTYLEWLVETDLEFVRRFGIDHRMAGFEDAEMRRDWARGDNPADWVSRIGLKYDLNECHEHGI
jgi:hypothetical protein